MNMTGMYICHPDQYFHSFFQAQTNTQQEKEQSIAESPDKGVTPWHKKMRKRAHEKMTMAASLVKRQIRTEVENDKVREVGEVIHIPLKDVKLVVQVDKLKSGLLKSWYVYHQLGHMSVHGNNVELKVIWMLVQIG